MSLQVLLVGRSLGSCPVVASAALAFASASAFKAGAEAASAPAFAALALAFTKLALPSWPHGLPCLASSAALAPHLHHCCCLQGVESLPWQMLRPWH